MSAADPTRPIVMVTGGVSPHITVLKRLRELGYETVLLDYKPNPVAAEHADRHLQISTLDTEAVLQAARDLNAHQIVNVCLDQPLPIVAHVRETLGLPSPLSTTAATALTDKAVMKDVLRDAGIDTARWTLVLSPDAPIPEDLRFPLVAKPVGGTGSLGLAVIRDPADLRQGLARSFEQARDAAVLLEEFVEGLELSVDYIAIDGHVQLLQTRERHKTWFSDGRENTCHATIAPAALSTEALDLLRARGPVFARAFGIENGPLLAQGILTADGRFVILEIAGRIGGGPGGTRVVHLSTGFDYVAASVDQQIGRTPLPPGKPDSRIFSANNVYASEGVFDQLIGMEDLIADGLVMEHYVYRQKGEAIPAHLSGRSRVTAFVAAAPDLATLRKNLKDIHDRLDILDPEGRSIMRRDIGYHLDV